MSSGVNENFAIGFEARIGGDAVDELSIDVSLACGERLLAHDRYRVVQREAEAAQRRITSVSRLPPSRRS